ncbi:hypothetical protein [Pseudogulbenkiania sp. MAI-1]|uniref:hypothetical protein n=1 Tax=Pseudogulbenkiania sp. MAI-1 TaxID=990370 RepID=UPI0012EBAFD7|nr:hypothetical protein [Pseudogulbenkiania sp. MAI-1]
MDRPRFPYATFKHDPAELVRVVLFPGEADQVCKELGCTLAQLRRWQTGAEAVPRPVFAFLRLWRRRTLGPQYGAWRDAYVDEDGTTLRHASGVGVRIEDVTKLAEYRRLSALCTQQAETIERLMVERNFYRNQCTREATFGLMLNRIFRTP